MSDYIAGIDEAGRGSVMGSLWIAMAVIENDKMLRKIGAKDSKKLTKEKREELFPLIHQHCETIGVININAEQLDANNINKLEMGAIVKLITGLKDTNIREIYIDALSANCEKDIHYLTNQTNNPNLKIIIEPKADDTYPIVSAASIIAKVNRDREIKELNIPGSGYPSDEITCNYLKEYYLKNNCFPPHTRTKWQTIKNMKKPVFEKRSFF